MNRLNREQSLTNTSHKECLNSQESTFQTQQKEKRNAGEGTPGQTGCATTREVLDVKSKRDKTHGQKHLSVLIGP